MCSLSGVSSAPALHVKKKKEKSFGDSYLANRMSAASLDV